MRYLAVLGLTVAMIPMEPLPAPAYAHGGRLAADGCHNDRQNGGRHCHRTGAMTAARHLPSGLLTVLYITPIALLPAQQALHRNIEARQEMERISTGMVTEKPVNETAVQYLKAAMISGRAR